MRIRKTIERVCEWPECGKVFPAKVDEVKRGWGRFCCKACASKQTRVNDPEAQSRSKLREAARKIYIERHGEPICACGKPADVHHKDGNPKNNADENHLPLCRACHTGLHNAMNPRRKKGVRYPNDKPGPYPRQTPLAA